MYLLSKKKTLRCNPLCSSTNICLKRTSEIKVATRMISVTNGTHHVSTTKSTLFVENKDELDTKEGTGKSMKNALHV